MIKKYKLAFIVFASMITSWQSVVYASQPPVEPYILSRQINAQPVDSSTCLILIKGDRPSDDSSDLAQQLSDNQARLAEMATRFQAINQAIQDLETGDSNALDALQAALDERIDQVFQAYLDEMEDFAGLSEEDQMAWILQDDQVVAYQEAVNQVQAEINQWVNERADLENDYQTLLYENDQVQADLDRQEASLAQLNQCQLYPYSTKPLNLDEVLLNPNPKDLNQLFVDLDPYLEAMVPLAYRKVSYEDIYQQFKQIWSADKIEAQLQGKAQVEIDPAALETYQYAKELSLFDVQVLAAMAMKRYQNDGDLNVYHQAYQQVVDLKSQQFNYFYQINDTVFEAFKGILADFLNTNQLTDAQSQEAVEAFHQRYQVRLVQFDDQTQTWQGLTGSLAGYLDLYAVRPLLQEEPPTAAEDPQVTSQDLVTTTIEQNQTEDGQTIEGEEKPSEDQADRLAKLKARLNQNQAGTSKANKDLPHVPAKEPSKVKGFDAKGKPGKKTTDKSPLPSTGEQQFYLILATILLVVGLIPLTIKIYRRWQHRRALQDQEAEDPWI
ncbi:hypothetical protein ACWODI_07300 [Facklamia languida]